MNENLCIALITTASIFAGFLVAFLSSYLTTRNREMMRTGEHLMHWDGN